MKYSSFIAVAVLLMSCQAHAGYAIFERPQITPHYVTVHSADGWSEWVENRGEPVVYPAGFGKRVCSSAPFSAYSSNVNRRTEVWTASGGTATSAVIFAVCPNIRLEREAQIRVGGQKRLQRLVDGYSAEERETWPYQRAEVLAWDMNHATPTPYIDAISADRGLSRDAFLTHVLQKVRQYTDASTRILGKQQRLIDRIWATQDVDELLSISWKEGE